MLGPGHASDLYMCQLTALGYLPGTGDIILQVGNLGGQWAGMFGVLSAPEPSILLSESFPFIG